MQEKTHKYSFQLYKAALSAIRVERGNIMHVSLNVERLDKLTKMLETAAYEFYLSRFGPDAPESASYFKGKLDAIIRCINALGYMSNKEKREISANALKLASKYVREHNTTDDEETIPLF